MFSSSKCLCRATHLVILGSLTLTAGGCVDLEPEPTPLSEYGGPLPAHCRASAVTVAEHTFHIEVLRDGLAGWTAVWREFPADLDVDPVIPTLAVLDVGLSGQLGEPRRVDLPAAALEDIATPLAYARVGDALVAVMGNAVFIVPLLAPESYVQVVGPDLVGLHAVAIDDDRAAVLGLDERQPGELGLSYRVLDVTSGEFTDPVLYPDIIPHLQAGPGMMALLGQAVRLYSLDSGELVAFWAAEPGHTLRAMRIDTSGTLLSGPVDLVSDPERRLFVPAAARLSGRSLGLVWTGEAGTEVRFRSLAADLSGVAQAAGLQVNVQTEGSQEFARLAPARPGLALAGWVTLGNGLHGRWLDTSGEPSAVTPFDSEFDLTGGCAAEVAGAPALVEGLLGPVAIWMDTGWWGPPRILASRVDLP